MNSIFSSFDALSAEFIGQSLCFFNTKTPASTIQDDQTKVTREINMNTDSHRSKRVDGARWAPELDGLHCFESLVDPADPAVQPVDPGFGGETGLIKNTGLKRLVSSTSTRRERVYIGNSKVLTPFLLYKTFPPIQSSSISANRNNQFIIIIHHSSNMNFIFSSFDVLSAQVIGQSLALFNTKNSASAIQDHQKKATNGNDNAKNTDSHRSNRVSTARWAPEFDGLHCFESLVFH
ncbi:hypothetical protein LXL04_029443 [Taraxacum kok-saghyz]